MRTSELLFVYGALACLAAAMFVRTTEQQAGANREAAPTDLGPADSVILTGKSGNLTLKNGDGRLQWGDQATSKAWSVAAVNTDKVMKLLLKSSRFEDERKALEEEAKKKDEDFRKRYKELEEKYKDMDPKSPAFEEGREAVNAFFKEHGEWRDSISTKFGKMQADQIEKAYRELTAAVDVVADRQKLDLVLRFIPTADKFEADEVGEAMMRVQGRTFVHYPESIDISAEVMKELNLKDE